MTRNEARKIMLDFADKYSGQHVAFDKLDDHDKMAFVLVDQYRYFSFLPMKDRIDRAISNAERHQENGFQPYSGMAFKFLSE